jgi:hypothetical protein
MKSWKLLGWQRHYGIHSAAIHTLPSIPELRELLGIKHLNSGRQIYPLGRSGIVSDDMEGLHARIDERGYVRLFSGAEFAMDEYRGQTREYNSCIPSIGRTKSIEERFLAFCRSIAFEDAIAEHPFVRLAEQSFFLDNPLFIDKEGMAQHYGLPTHMLDVTNNFDVASFFATCAWHNKIKKYEPVIDTKHHGIIYRLTPALLFDQTMPDSTFGQFHIVGWQPLPRPEQQRASALRMSMGQSLNEISGVECFRFRHRARVSLRIWKIFDEGRALFPDDAAAELAKQAEALHRFTRDQIDRAWSRSERWTEKTFCAEERLILESRFNLVEVTAPLLSWVGLDVETDAERLSEQLQDVLSRVRYRRVLYPE